MMELLMSLFFHVLILFGVAVAIGGIVETIGELLGRN